MGRNLQQTKPETPGQTPSLNDKCTGFFYVHYTTHGTYSFTSHPKDEAIMVKRLAQGQKCRYRESNPHSGFISTPELERCTLDRSATNIPLLPLMMSRWKWGCFFSLMIPCFYSSLYPSRMSRGRRVRKANTNPSKASTQDAVWQQQRAPSHECGEY